MTEDEMDEIAKGAKYALIVVAIVFITLALILIIGR